MAEVRLIIGLGNPGKAYEGTRHNIGFHLVKTCAEKWKMPLKENKVLKSEFATGAPFGGKLLLLLPLTYMNNSGLAVRQCVDYFEIATEQLIVVCDDVDLPFGELRLRAQGSPGGHNGLKDIATHLGGENYARLKIGVSRGEGGDLTPHVLGQFSLDEQKNLPAVVEKGVEILEQWARAGMDAALQKLSISKNYNRKKEAERVNPNQQVIHQEKKENGETKKTTL